MIRSRAKRPQTALARSIWGLRNRALFLAMLSVAGEFLTKGSCRSRAAVKLDWPRSPAAGSACRERAGRLSIGRRRNIRIRESRRLQQYVPRPRASTSEIIEGGGAGRAQAEIDPKIT